jgi:ribose 5-phosphate isomerase B
MIIALASDHGGFELKEQVAGYLFANDFEIRDLGTENGQDSVDYPIYGKKCAETVVSGEADLGIVFCGTGIGISIAANKVKGARCALVTSDFSAEMAKAHNDANLLAFGGRTSEFPDVARWIKIWLETETDQGERHARRREQLNEM